MIPSSFEKKKPVSNHFETSMNLIPAVPLKLRIPPPLMNPIRFFALTRLVREGSTRGSAFFLPARERQLSGSSRGSHHPPRLLRRYLKHSPSKPLWGVYAFRPCLSTVFHCFLLVLNTVLISFAPDAENRCPFLFPADGRPNEKHRMITVRTVPAATRSLHTD